MVLLETDNFTIDHRGEFLSRSLLYGHRIYPLLLSLLLCRRGSIQNVAIFDRICGIMDLSEFIQYAPD